MHKKSILIKTVLMKKKTVNLKSKVSYLNKLIYDEKEKH